jgi:hypothetical protein
MRPAPLLLPLLAFLLAGCTEGADPSAQDVASDAPGTSDQDIARQEFVLRATYDLHLSEANTGGLRTGVPPFLGVPSENCLGLVAGVKILAGYANATWTPQSVAAEDLLVALDYGPSERAMVEGRSMLSLDLRGITTGNLQSIAGTSDGFQGSILTVNLSGDAGAAADQKVRLDLWLRYEAGEELVPETGFTCSPFTLPLP